MSNLEETKKFLEKHCLQRCNHNANESCICKVAICFKEIEKAQEQEKVLEIIKEKNVDILTLNSWFSKGIGDLKTYNYDLEDEDKLTQEEFDLLKKYFNENKEGKEVR